ncbi:Phosphatidylinositol N-acetylglucosaminyltransferase ERI1 subunit [Nakaseomyces bracarensis]|uniref:Phosphatidylinositol N-acetylglucosaminyltransferase ERI1 subunit n=1 Tax=Nakaseomyces bracarensis TaxID=273131 RepID=A0ABR4NU84_9SACH
MNQKQAGLAVLAFTYGVVLLVLSSFWIIHTYYPSAMYYWQWVWLLPASLWAWCVKSWCDAEMFGSSKQEE